MTSLKYDADTHTYSVDGKIVPGVSQILRAAGFSKSYAGVDPWYADRGSKVHKACELHDQGALDYDDLDPQLQPFINAYADFVDEHRLRVGSSECMFYHPGLEYAGRWDRVFERDDQELWLVEMKCGKYHWSHVHQLESYVLGLNATHDDWEIAHTVVLELHQEGGYSTRFSSAEDRADARVEFIAACKCWHARAKHSRNPSKLDFVGENHE